MFRTLASITRSLEEAMIPSALLGVGPIIYTGFTLPTAYMPNWSRWMVYINPLGYAFESLMANEYHGREFPCASMIPQGPGYEGLPPYSQVCSVVGAELGSSHVRGDKYINLSFNYWNEHKWRNVAIIVGFMILFFAVYLAAAENQRGDTCFREGWSCFSPTAFSRLGYRGFGPGTTCGNGRKGNLDTWL